MKPPIEAFPADENGDVLRRMHQGGDDLSKPRDIDFTVVFPTQHAAASFASIYSAQGYRTKINNSEVVAELPWDVVVIKHMVPTHGEITSFEKSLEVESAALAGRNDGWGSFQQ